MSRLYLSKPCAFFRNFRTRCCGRSQRPAFPAPSLRERDTEIVEPGQKARRGNEHVCFHRHCERSEAIQLCRNNKAGCLRRFASRNDGFVYPSCPGLSRASTSLHYAPNEVVDGRDKPGHDGYGMCTPKSACPYTASTLSGRRPPGSPGR